MFLSKILPPVQVLLGSSLEQGYWFCLCDGESQAWKWELHVVPDLAAPQHFTILGFQKIFPHPTPKEIRKLIPTRFIIHPLGNLLWFRRSITQAVFLFRRWTLQIPPGDRSNAVFKPTLPNLTVCKEVQIWTTDVYHRVILVSTNYGPDTSVLRLHTLLEDSSKRECKSCALQRRGKKYIRKYLINKSHLRFFPLLCRSSSSRKDKLFHNHQSKQSLVSCGFVSHVFIPPRTTSCASPPTPLWFIFPFPAIPPVPTYGPHIWRSERQLACGCSQAPRADGRAGQTKVRLTLQTFLPGGYRRGCPFPAQPPFLTKESRNLVSLRAFICLTCWNEIGQMDKSHTSITNRGGRSQNHRIFCWRCWRNPAKIWKRHNWGKHFHFANYLSPQNHSAACSVLCPCSLLVPDS